MLCWIAWLDFLLQHKFGWTPVCVGYTDGAMVGKIDLYYSIMLGRIT